MADRHLSLSIKSTSGSLSGERFNDQNKAEHVLDAAIRKIPLEKNPERPYVCELPGCLSLRPRPR